MSHSRKVTFPNAEGHDLAARLELPDGEPLAYALFAHCFTCSKDIHAATRISRGLCDEGIAVLRFDFTGLGSSGGDFANTNFTSNVTDLVCAADYLRRDHRAPQLLVGHSLGGAAVLAAAREISEVRAVATVAAPAEPAHVLQHIDAKEEEIRERGSAEIELAGRHFRIKQQLLDDLEEQNLQARIRELGCALLIFHSPSDEIVGIDNARKIFEAALHPKSFVALDGADHLLAKESDSKFVATMLAAWAARYVQASSGTERETDQGSVLVEEIEKSYAQRITARSHVFLADEPAGVGTDRGPTPYELLLAALGTCTSMTLRMYAKRKGWPLDHVSVRLRHERVHADDCADCDAKEGKIERIERLVAIRGDLDDEQRQRLLEIADRCPVHRTLEAEKAIVTRAASEGETAG